MKGYRFRLARVLRVRRIEEQLARAGFLERQREAEQSAALRAEGLDLAHRMREQLRDQIGSGSIEPRLVLGAQSGIDAMADLCRRRDERARTHQAQADRAREPWSDSRRDVRALEALEQKQMERFRSEQEKRANRELDETAARRAQDRRGRPDHRARGRSDEREMS